MAFLPTKTSPLITLFIIVLGFLAGYFYYSFISSNNIDAVVPPPGLYDSAFIRLKNMTLRLDLFDTPAFSSLQIYGPAQIQPAQGGRQDIFNP